MAETKQGGGAPTPERYPGYAYPLVAPLYRASNVSEDDPGRREKRYFDVFESIIKYITTILVCQYRADGLNEPAVEQNIQRLARPSLGHFASLLRDLLRLYSQFDKDRVGALVQFYEESVARETFEHVVTLSKVVDYPTPRNARSYRHLIDVLIQYRNHVAHGAGISAREYEQRLPALIHLIGALLDRLRFLAEMPLIEVQEIRHLRAGTEAEIRLWNGVLPRKAKREVELDLPIGHLGLDRSAANLGFVDLFPFCVALEGSDGAQPDVYFLNGATKSKIRYLSYGSAHVEVLDSRHPDFAAIQTALRGSVQTVGAGLPEHMQDRLRISEQSRVSYHRALAELRDGEFETALVQLKHAIEDSPAYRDAVMELARQQESRGQLEACQATLAAYARLVPDDVEVLLEDARILRKLGRLQESGGRVRQILDADPANPEALAFQKEASSHRKAVSTISDETTPGFKAQLPYEYFISCLTGANQRGSKRLLVLFILSVTFLEATVFVLVKDVMMALTILAMGATWGSTVWATFRIRRLLGESRPNFMAFLHSRRGYTLDRLLDDLILPVFGRFPQPERSAAAVAAGFRHNAARFSVVAGFAVGGAAWLFLITNYSSPGLVTDFSYSIFGLLIFLSFGYLLSNTVGYYRFLRDLRSQTIHFSLVQHPKLSIRYLSNLSRRLSYPLLVVSTIATFTLYLGPFLPKLTFSFGLLIFLIFVSYSYYSTIFLVRRVIVRNKWRLISQFSVHFDAPFDDLVVHARSTDLERLKELIEMRDFLDSMDVWAEKKSVLVAVSFFYIGVLLFSTLGISNAMTLKIVPFIAKSVEQVTAAEPLKEDLAAADQSSEIKLTVKNVDDTVLAFWGASEDEVFKKRPDWVKEKKQKGVQVEDFGRNDWHNGVHGKLTRSLTLEDREELHLLVVIYNKYYKPFLYMGGGKLSYDIDVSFGRKSMFRKQRTLRSNERSVGYWVYFRFSKVERKILRIEAGAQLEEEEEVALEQRIQGFVDSWSQLLAQEEAGVDWFNQPENAGSDPPDGEALPGREASAEEGDR